MPDEISLSDINSGINTSGDDLSKFYSLDDGIGDGTGKLSNVYGSTNATAAADNSGNTRALTVADTSGFPTGLVDTVKNLFTDSKGNLNLQALGAVGGGLAGLLGAMNSKTTPTGYQGGIPNLSASRTMLTAPPTVNPDGSIRRPGQGGINYGGNVTYTRASTGADPLVNLSGTSGGVSGLAGLATGLAAALPAATTTTTKPVVTNTAANTATNAATPVANLGSKGYQEAIAAGLTPAQYLNNINQWILDNPRATQDQINAVMKQFNVSNADLQEALRTSNFSDATKYALTNNMGLQGLNQNIQTWLEKNPYATNTQIQDAMKAVGVNDEDVARAMTGMNSSAAKEYAVVHDMGLDQLYKNILDYQAAGHTPEEIAAAMAATGVEQRDINNAAKYAAAQNYTANPTSAAATQNFLPPTDLGSVANKVADIIGGTKNETQAPTGLDTSNSIYQYFADPATQAALASGDTRSIAETMQALGWSPEDVAAATGVSAADVKAQYNAALGGDKASSDNYYQDYFAGGGMARGRYLQGGTDGMADKIPAQIGESQPAALSHGEFVVPADVVSHLGNGNSDAGAQKLYQMMDKIRMARTGTKKQGKKINPDKFMPGGLASAYAKGGSVKHYLEGGGISGVGTAANAGVTGTESALSNWAGPYVTNMLGQGQALANMPYEAYTGPLTAGPSELQTGAFKTASGLTTPTAMSDAATQAGNISTAAQGLSYTPTTFGNQYTAPTAYKPMTTDFTSDVAKTYMNPYLQQSLDPQLAEARRQSQITQMQNAAKLTGAGAFGGSRQAIMDAETQRNLGTNLANITGQGYNTAYTNAMQQFNADQQRKMQEAQFGAQQGMTAAQLGAQYGLAGQQAGEQARQFGANYGLQGLQTGLQAAQAQGQLGYQQNQAGLANLASQLEAGNVQRGIESEGIAADKAQFEEARANPYKMVQFQQSLLQGLPTNAQSINMAQPSTLQQILAGAGGVAGLFPTTGTTGAQDLAAALKKLGIG